jgi:type IV pilus assembly protein PilN
MIRINLLPYREKEKKENLQRQIILMAGGVIFVVLILVSVYLFISISISNLEKQIAQAEAKLIILNKKVGDIEGFKRDKKDVEQKLGVIKSLEGNRLFPVRMLDEINQLVPAKDAWLDKIVETAQDLRIEGVARDNGIVAVFMKNLEKADFIQSVELVVSQEKEVVGVKLQQFTLTCMKKKGA